MHHRSWVLVAALVLACPACIHRRSAVPGASESQSADSITLSVTNHLADQVVLFATAGRTYTYRMGYVDPGARKDFALRLPWLFGRGVQFVATPPVGGWSYGAEMVSGYLTLSPGDVIDWGINEGRSRAAIRPR